MKFRGIASDSELKPVQINVSPDLLKIDKVLELKSKYKVAKNFAIETDKNLGKKKKIRTYNFKENRVTDHRIKLTLHRLDSILAGDLDEVVEALLIAERDRQLAESFD